MDIRLALFTGIDIPVPECQLVIHQPTIKEISYIGEKEFLTGVQCLSIHKNMYIKDKSALSEINNFQIFMTIMQNPETKDKAKDVKKLLSLVFTDYNALITPRSIILQNKNQSIVIDETNFEILQEYIRAIFCAKTGPMDQQAFNPANEKAREIAEKLMRGRERVAAQKGQLDCSIFSQYLSILAIALHLPLSELVNMTMFQVYDLIERYSLYINWDLDVRTRLAGGKPDSQPENWMKNIHNN